MDIQKTFMELTDYTYILGDEHLLLDRLPKNVETDEIGNYFLEIGESETMFCSHLDTAAWKKEKVEFDIFKSTNGDIGIGTDRTTILGADDKAGVVLLLTLIENKVPGLYYFFIGEESGLVGSRGISKRNPEKFKKYKRCIAFDRRDYGSVITRQMGRTCCSSKFADDLIMELGINGMKYKQDPTGVYTDSAVFTELIPECTNLSVGYFHEHSVEEVQNITYLEKLAEAIVGVKWEELSTNRPVDVPWELPLNRKVIRNGDPTFFELENLFYDVDDLMDGVYHMYCINSHQFKPEKEMVYIEDGEDDDSNTTNHTSVYIHDDKSITINDTKYDSFEDFEYDAESYVKGSGIKGSSKLKDNENLSKLGLEFEEDLDVQDFLFDLLNMSHIHKRNYLNVKEVDRVLNARNKKLESFIMWLFQNGNDGKDTYGLTWNEKKNRLELDIED